MQFIPNDRKGRERWKRLTQKGGHAYAMAIMKAVLFSCGLLGLFVLSVVPDGLAIQVDSPLGSPEVMQQGNEASKLSVSTKEFILGTKGQQFLIHWQKRIIPIPRKWLIALKDEQDEEGEGVSSFSYDRDITSFPIGNGELGLHLSSFDAMAPGSGSAQAAAGRDVFLVFNPKTSAFRPGLINLGRTKGRLRYLGCFSAVASHFIIEDINGDGLTDIGTVEERMMCKEYTNDQGVDVVAGPFYRQDLIKWHLFHKGQWRYDEQYDGRLLEQVTELPLIGIAFSPVDFVGEVYWQSYDPRVWRSRSPQGVLYVPAYRKELIRQHEQKR